MPFSGHTIAQCQKILENLAKSGDRITYGDLMRALGIGRQSLADCLNPIYQTEISAQPPRPDLTLIPHYSGSWFGRYNSRGARAQGITIDPNNKTQVQAYKDDLRNVYRHWGGKPKGKLKEWLES